jgi:hypothetical protein
LFVLAGCGTVGTRQVSTAPMGSVSGGTSDPGTRWVGAEPLGAIAVETQPRLAPTSSPSRRAADPITPSRLAPTSTSPHKPAPPPPPAANVIHRGAPYTVPPPPPPPWNTPPPPPPPGSAASWSPPADVPDMREPLPPPARELGTTAPPPDGPPDPGPTIDIEPVPAAQVQPTTRRLAEVPVYEQAPPLPTWPREPGKPVTDSGNLYAPPSGILPPPLIRKR